MLDKRLRVAIIALVVINLLTLAAAACAITIQMERVSSLEKWRDHLREHGIEFVLSHFGATSLDNLRNASGRRDKRNQQGCRVHYLSPTFFWARSR